MRRPSTSTVQAPHWPWSQPFFVPGEVEMVAQDIEQRRPGQDVRLTALAIDGDGHGNFLRQSRARLACTHCESPLI